MPDIPVDIIEVEKPLSDEFNEWMKFELDLLREFAKDLSRHDAKITNTLLNFIYAEMTELENTLLKPINAAAMMSYDAKVAIENATKIINNTLSNISYDTTQGLNYLRHITENVIDGISNLGSYTNMWINDSSNRTINEIQSSNNIIHNSLTEMTNDITNQIKDKLTESIYSIKADVEILNSNIHNNIISSTKTLENHITNNNANLKTIIDNQTTYINKSIENLTTAVMKPNTEFQDALDYIWTKIQIWLTEKSELNSNSVLQDINSLIGLQKTLVNQLDK